MSDTALQMLVIFTAPGVTILATIAGLEYVKRLPSYREQQARRYDREARANLRKAAQQVKRGDFQKAAGYTTLANAALDIARNWRAKP